MLAGAAAVRRSRCCCRAPGARRRGCAAPGCWSAFALLAAFTALSITWSLMPSDSWLETNRTLAYLAALGRRARARPARPAALERADLAAIAIGAVAICAWSLLTKVFPAALAPDETFARLRPPFDYWNSVGLAAALGIPPLLWLAARRSGHAARQRARLAGARRS